MRFLQVIKENHVKPYILNLQSAETPCCAKIQQTPSMMVQRLGASTGIPYQISILLTQINPTHRFEITFLNGAVSISFSLKYFPLSWDKG